MQGFNKEPDLLDEMVTEWYTIEAKRVEICSALLYLCKRMHEIRQELTDNMLEILVEENWRNGEVTKALADGVAGLLKAVKAIEKPIKMEKLSEPRYKKGDSDGVQ